MSQEIEVEYELNEDEMNKMLTSRDMERPILTLFSFEWPNATAKDLSFAVNMTFSDLKGKYGIKLVRHDYFFMSIGLSDFDFLILAYTCPLTGPELAPDSVTVLGPDNMIVLDGFTIIHKTGNPLDFGQKITEFGKGFDLVDKHLVDYCLMSGVNNSGIGTNIIIGSRLFFNYYLK